MHMQQIESVFEAISHLDRRVAVSMLNDGVSLNSLASDGQSIWSYVVPCGASAVTLALELGANPNLTDMSDWAALDWCIYAKDSTCAEILIKAGAKLDKKDVGSFNLLHTAALVGADLVLDVLAMHAPLELFVEKNILNRTPYEEAVAAGHQRCADLLVMHYLKSRWRVGDVGAIQEKPSHNAWHKTDTP